MIKKILKLKNIGLLQDGCASGAIELAAITAIYAENGRGKSTFAAIMRACQLADAGPLNARRTLDSTESPEVTFLIHPNQQVTFSANTWAGTPPEIAVFDSEFVDQNVYSGFEVSPGQRKSLLEFALGNSTVALKQQIDQLTEAIEVQSRKRTDAEKSLVGYAAPYSVVEYIALQPALDAQQRVDELQRQLDAARNVKTLIDRPNPSTLSLISFDIAKAFQTLGKQLADIQDTAESEVKSHLNKFHASGLEDWVSAGQKYIKDECPFCGQSMTGIELIKAYRTFFNKAYIELQKEAYSLENRIASDLSNTKIDSLLSIANINTSRIEVWADQLDLTNPILDSSELKAKLQRLQIPLLNLASTKRQNPLMQIGTDVESIEAATTLSAINSAIDQYNAHMAEQLAIIGSYKTKLSGEDIKTLQETLKKAEAMVRHQLPEVLELIRGYEEADKEKKRLEAEKNQTRQLVDTQMQSDLQQYQVGINQLLSAFGAEFSIEQMKTSYSGGEPKTEYGLSIRSKAVKLGKREDIASKHGFASTLSEADKRTLAFAFFVARLQTDPSLQDKIIVIDDPVSSMDRTRRQQSIQQIVELAPQCKQLIVLSHDAYFMRELRDRLQDTKPNPLSMSVLSIRRVQNNYSAFDNQFDLDDICSSDYYRHHKLVADFVDGKSTSNMREVAKSIRPLLEGYYHRRFPGIIPKRLMFGQIIALATNTSHTSPLTQLRPLAKELGEVNDYAGKFHHDTNPSADTAAVVDGELLGIARRTLDLIYKNG